MARRSNKCNSWEGRFIRGHGQDKKMFPFIDFSEPVIKNNSHEPLPIATLIIAATSSVY